MITQEKIKIYLKFDGDIDAWTRTGTKKEKLVMTDEDWYTIDSILQDLSLAQKKLTSPEFNSTLDDKLNQSCDGEDTVNQLKRVVHPNH